MRNAVGHLFVELERCYLKSRYAIGKYQTVAVRILYLCHVELSLLIVVDALIVFKEVEVDALRNERLLVTCNVSRLILLIVSGVAYIPIAVGINVVPRVSTNGAQPTIGHEAGDALR